jgi:hypothetical protein
VVAERLDRAEGSVAQDAVHGREELGCCAGYWEQGGAWALGCREQRRHGEMNGQQTIGSECVFRVLCIAR